MSKEETFNELDEESKDRKAFHRESKFVLKDRDIFEMIEPAYHNYKIACRIEQLIKDYHYIIVCLLPLQIDVEIDNDRYSICGHIDDRQIVHLVIKKVAYSNVEDDFSSDSEKVIDVHESQLEQTITEALNELRHKYVNYNEE